MPTMNDTSHPVHLPPGLNVLERGWLSANSVVCTGPNGTALVDSGYCSHADQTLALVESCLGGRPLDRLLNTHLHSDHCGGNHALQQRYPAMRTCIPPGEAAAVRNWDADSLSYQPTGQQCPRFNADDLLQPGSTVDLAGLDWQVLAAPGHDPHAVLLFEPEHGVLISGDALWDNGFGVVFPEIEGAAAFDEVSNTLDLIESLSAQTVVPGHGPVFGGSIDRVAQALARARSRLAQFRANPQQHTLYAAKVLLKFRLMDLRHLPLVDFLTWASSTPYLAALHRSAETAEPLENWVQGLLSGMARSGSLQLSEGWISDR